MDSSTTSHQSTAVSTFAKFLRQARSGTADIKIPKALSEAFGPVFQDRNNVEEAIVDAVVSAIDSNDDTLYKRLDIKCLSIFCGILRLSAECPSQLRGYCVLAEFLHQNLDSEHPPNQHTELKKKLLGLKNMLPVFTKFLDNNRSDQARRAFGFFVSTILTGNPSNRKVMADGCSDETWRALGKIILTQESEMTKLLAGSIIREMLSYGLREDKLWPVNDTPAAVISKFPRDPSHTSQWIWDFHSYLENECPQDRVGDQREVAVFAHVIRLPDIIFEMEDESAILVTVNATLSILIPANLTRSATYLDIPFDRISNIKMSKSDSQSQRQSQHSQSQTTTPCCMNIELTESLGWSHLMNHKARQANSIDIVFDYMPDAIAVNEALAARQAVAYDDNVSPSQLQYDPRSPSTEISTYRQNESFASEPTTTMRVLQAIESDAITCTGDEEAHDNIAEVQGGSNVGTLQTDGNIVLDSVHIVPRVEAKQSSVGDTNSVTAEFGTKPGSRAVEITPPPAAGELLAQEKREVHTIANQQQGSKSDLLNDSSPQGSKLKQPRDDANLPVLKERNEVHEVTTTEANDERLSRNLPDHNGLLTNAGHVQSHDGDSLGDYIDIKSKRALATGRGSAAKDQPQTQGESKVRSNIVNGKISGQRGSEYHKSDHDKVHESAGSLDQRGKKSRAVPAPEATMVAQPNNIELQRKGKVAINTSNISRPRPKPQIRSTQIPQRPSGSKAKTRRPNDEDEQVDWFEDMTPEDNLDHATPARKKAAKQPDISSEPKKRKTARVRNKEVVLNKVATSQSTKKPRRAAAVKADMKIRGLADPINMGPSSGKKAVIKNAVSIKSASKTAPPPGVKASETPDLSVIVSNQVKNTATRLEKDLSRPSADVRARATLIRSPTLPESPPSRDHREGRKSDPLPAHGVVKLTNPPNSNKDVALPIKGTELVKESLVEPDAVVPGAVWNGGYDMDKHQSMVEKAAEQPAMDCSLDFSEVSPVSEVWHLHEESDSSFLRPQVRNTMTTLHQPEAIISNMIEETNPMSALSEVHSKIICSGKSEKNGGSFSGVDIDSPGLSKQVSKLSYHKPGSSKDVDHGAPAFSEHLFSPSASQKPNELAAENEARKRTTKSGHGFTAHKLEALLSPINSLLAEKRDVEARSIVQGPQESKVKAIEKRRMEEEDPRQAKKSRVGGWQPHQNPDEGRAEIRTPKNNVPELRRKPVVVHFEASGPKYERTQQPNKSKVPAELTIPQSKRDHHSKAIQSKKRKAPDTVNDGPWNMDDLSNRKRRKGDHTKMQPLSGHSADALAVKPKIHSSTGQLHRHSSQTSRVNEQGSPMPTVYSRKVSLAIPKVMAPTPKIPNFLSDISSNGEYYNFDGEASQIPEPSVPAALHDTLEPMAKTKAVAGRNTKYRPSSPNAPSSTIADMTAHRIQSSGQFVGIQTNDVVVPQKPQDPFGETAQNRPVSKFIEKLRKYSNEQKVVENVDDNGRHRDRKFTTHLGGNDPEKTLIEENLSEDEMSSTASSSSSSSCSCESQSQADAEPSDEGSGSDSAWNKALRDDQRDIFEKLYEISHVVTRDLIDKETAIKDMIKDYRQQGDWILDRYEEERQREFAIRQAERTKANAALLDTFRSVEEDCAKRIREAERNMIEFRSSTEARQARTNASIQALEALLSDSE